MGRHFAEHAAIAYAMTTMGDVRNAQDLLTKIVAWGWASFTKRDLWQRVRRRFGSLDQMDSALLTLERLAYIRRVDEGTKSPGRPSEAFELNPRIADANPSTQSTKLAANPSDGGFVDSGYASVDEKTQQGSTPFEDEDGDGRRRISL